MYWSQDSLLWLWLVDQERQITRRIFALNSALSWVERYDVRAGISPTCLALLLIVSLLFVDLFQHLMINISLSKNFAIKLTINNLCIFRLFTLAFIVIQMIQYLTSYSQAERYQYILDIRVWVDASSRWVLRWRYPIACEYCRVFLLRLYS